MKKIVWLVGCVMILVLIVVTIKNPSWWKEAKILPPMPTKYDCSEIEAEINKYDWDKETALAVAKAESDCDANAYGDQDFVYTENNREYGYSVGAFQVRILPGREHCDTYEVDKNISCAYEIYQKAGNNFTPWSMWNNGRYKKYLQHSVFEF